MKCCIQSSNILVNDYSHSVVCAGIDLGTTNSAISVIEGGKPVIIPCNGARIVPSIVGYDRMGRVIIGERVNGHKK